MAQKFKENCVCFKWGGCVAINRFEFNCGFTCEKCNFFKTEEEYIKQTGRTYKEEMEVLKRGRNN